MSGGWCEAVEMQVAGIPAVRLENEWLRAVILVGKGTDVWELTYKPLGMDLLLKTKTGLEPLRGRDLQQDRLTHYAECYPGGWQEIIPNRARFGSREIGKQREGESAGMPWDYEIRQDAAKVSLRCWISLPETPLSIEKIFVLTADTPELHLTEEAANAGRDTVHFIWTHHPAFGSPLVSEHAQIMLPAGSRAFNVLRYEQHQEMPPAQFEEAPSEVTLPSGSRKNLYKVDPRAEAGEGCYMPLYGFATGEAGIRNPALNLQLSLHWDPETFSCLRYWSQNDSEMYTVALEPSSSRFSDIDDCIRHADCIALLPGEKRSTWVKFRLDRLV